MILLNGQTGASDPGVFPCFFIKGTLVPVLLVEKVWGLLKFGVVILLHPGGLTWNPRMEVW